MESFFVPCKLLPIILYTKHRLKGRVRRQFRGNKNPKTTRIRRRRQVNVDGIQAHSGGERLRQRHEVQGPCREIRGVDQHHKIMEKAAWLGKKKGCTQRKKCAHKKRWATWEQKRCRE